MTFPSYRDIDLSKTKLKWGYYILGLIEQCRPDIELISIQVDPTQTCDEHGNVKQRHCDVDYNWLPARLEQAFGCNKKVGLVIEDEHVHFSLNPQLVSIVNHYQHYPLYWITQFDQKRSDLHYVAGQNIQCKILELPWIILNECLMYNNIKQHRVPTLVSRGSRPNNKFLTMTGRYEPFRKRLLQKLIEHDMHHHGLLTIQNTFDDEQPYDINSHITVEPQYPYHSHPNKQFSKMAAQFYINNQWIGCNTQNFLYIEQQYRSYPMVIIPETWVYHYFATEKSVWPILLGKLFLIFGSVDCMQYIQRFYDIDLSDFVNLEFDAIDPGVDDKIIDAKLDMMIAHNKDLILNAHEIHRQNYQRIQAARNTVGPNLYRFVVSQVAQIQ